MTWSTPWAWALTTLAALPIVAHLWSRTQPRSMAFPTLRFLRAAAPVSRRLRRVHEWPLLLLRLVIVVLICAAAAGPTLTASWRDAAWRSRLHRVIVLDQEVPADRRAGIIADLRRDVSSVAIIGPSAITDLLDEGIDLAVRAARSRRSELVIVWTGDRLALTGRDLADVPSAVGVRLVPVASRGVGPDRDAPVAPALTIEAGQDERGVRDSVLRMAQGLRLPSSAASVLVRWPGARRLAAPAAEPRPPVSPAAAAVLRALTDIASDPRVRDAADRSLNARTSSMAGGAPSKGHRLATSLDDAVLMHGWAQGDRLVIELDAPGASPLGWWSVVAAAESLARWDRTGSAEAWSAQDLVGLQRDAPMPEATTLPGGLDTRATWGGVLALLVIEQIVRRARTSREAPDAV